MPYGWRICNFRGYRGDFGFVQQGEDQIALRPKKIGLEFWDGPRVQGACHHVQRGVNGLSALLGGQTVFMTIQRTGLFVEASSIFCLMYFSFLLTAI
jgi:hypothetical protein